MEFEVRYVAGIQDCFASLPLFLIQTLQSTSSALLPPLLTLELRSRTNDHPWIVAWSGATSSSTAIEVSQQFGECISLPNDTVVQVRVLSNVAKATLVTIEPNTEDDWEVLELNSELAEAAILKQKLDVQARVLEWLLSIKKTIPVNLVKFVRPLAYLKDGSKVLLEMDSQKLVWYDLERKKTRKVKIEDAPDSFSAEVFVGSLIPLDNREEEESKRKKKEELKRSGKKRDDFLSAGFKLVL